VLEFDDGLDIRLAVAAPTRGDIDLGEVVAPIGARVRLALIGDDAKIDAHVAVWDPATASLSRWTWCKAASDGLADGLLPVGRMPRATGPDADGRAWVARLVGGTAKIATTDPATGLSRETSVDLRDGATTDVDVDLAR